MFVAAYWWKVKPGKEAQFRAAWRRGTELIREHYGSLGSRLHRDAEGEAALQAGVQSGAQGVRRRHRLHAAGRLI